MDRTSWLAVIVCTGLLFGWFYYQKGENEKALTVAAQKAAAEKANQPATPAEVDPAIAKADNDKPDTVTADAKIETVTLENEELIYEFTNQGAGISSIHLKDYNRHLDDPSEKVIINQKSPHPIGALSSGPKNYDQTVWVIKSKSDKSLTFTTTTPEKFVIEKTYTLAADGQDQHEINLDITILNDSGVAMQLGASRYIYMGSMSPLHLNEWAMQIGYFWKEKDSKFTFETVDSFKGGFFSKGDKPSVTQSIESYDWAGINGQFFAIMFKGADETRIFPSSMWAARFPVVVEGNKEASGKKNTHAIEAAVALPDILMNPGDRHTQRYRVFTGPKQFKLLNEFGDDRQVAMNYDQIPIFGWMFGWAIKPLASWLTLGLHFMHNNLGVAWGVAIILITLMIRIIIWPVYAKSTRTMKRMSKLTPKMTELKEKYKDNPQKMNEETMKLYRDYGVNPLGGCLPMFIQLPVFLAFYRMLWSEVDLRHESFLWVKDLSMPDTQFEIPFPFFGFTAIPINPLPILMAVTSLFQMMLTPKTGDKSQRMIFMLMPVIFLVICYNFAAALSLYWTTQNIFSIFQTWLMNKLPEPELKKKKGGGFMAKLQEQAAAQQKAKQSGQAAPAAGADRTKLASEKGDRHTKSKKRKKR